MTWRRAAARRRPTGAALREAARIELGLRELPRGRRLRRVHRHLRGPRRPRPAPGHRGPAADGRRLRLRGRGRLEDRRSRPGDEGDGDRPAGRHVLHGGLHLPPRPGRAEVLGAHMLEVCPSIAAAGRPARSIRCHRRQEPTRCGSSSPRRPGPASSSASSISATASASSSTRSTWSSPRSAAEPPGRPGGLGAAARPQGRRSGLDARRRSAPHGFSTP